jgi:hypothetical protein
MQLSLYPIQQQHLELLRQIEDAEGELTPELEQELQLTQEKFEQQAVSYGFVVKSYDDAEGIIDAEIKRLQALKEKTVKRKELFKQYLSNGMQQFGVEKIETPTLKLSFRKSEIVQISDDDMMPDEYCAFKKQANKQKIKEALKAGETIIGAALVTKQNLQIK